MTRTNLDGINRVRFNDFTEYESEKSNNGGCYGFWADYNRLENGLFEISRGTTADFEYCPVCGDFHSYNEETCGDFQTVTESELLKLINDFKETDDCFIEYSHQNNTDELPPDLLGFWEASEEEQKEIDEILSELDID